LGQTTAFPPGEDETMTNKCHSWIAQQSAMKEQSSFYTFLPKYGKKNNIACMEVLSYSVVSISMSMRCVCGATTSSWSSQPNHQVFAA